MVRRTRSRMTGASLIAGGVIAGTAHLFDSSPPADPALLARYIQLSEPIHLLLFAGATLVLLGWFGQYALECSGTGVMRLLGFASVFFGILLGDLLHCTLEFSVLPVLAASTPYALPAIVADTYRSTPLAVLQGFGLVGFGRGEIGDCRFPLARLPPPLCFEGCDGGRGPADVAAASRSQDLADGRPILTSVSVS
jgi:hypothetical protein